MEPNGPTQSNIVGTADKKYEFSASGTSTTNVSSAITSVSGITTTTGQGFRVSTQFSYTGLQGQFATAGLLLLSNNTASSFYRVAYNLGVGNNGVLEFAGATFASSTVGTSTPATPVGGNPVIYTLTVSGTYLASGALSLTAQLSNDVNGTVVQATATTNTTPSTGSYFGMRTASFTDSAVGGSNPNPTITATYDNFKVEAIPEPSSTALLAAGAAALGLRRRRA